MGIALCEEFEFLNDDDLTFETYQEFMNDKIEDLPDLTEISGPFQFAITKMVEIDPNERPNFN